MAGHQKGRRNKNYSRLRRRYLVDKALNTGAILPPKRSSTKWIIDTIVHAVASEHEIRLNLSKHTIQALGKHRPWKRSARVSRPGARNRFTGKPHVDDLKVLVRTVRFQVHLHVVDILTGIGDAVTKKQYSLHAPQQRQIAGVCGGDGQHAGNSTTSSANSKIFLNMCTPSMGGGGGGGGGGERDRPIDATP